MASSGRTILIGSSAWQYWCTNPLLRDYEVPESRAYLPYPAGAGIPNIAQTLRRDANDARRTVAARLRFDLKNLTLPVHIFAESTPDNQPSRLVEFHHCSTLPDEEVLSLGGNLYAASPALALIQLGRNHSELSLAQLMLEACGIYAVSAETDAMRFTIDAFQHAGMLTREDTQNRRRHICEYYDEFNRPVHFTDDYGDVLPWEPCYDQNGRRLRMWKRPPLLTVEQLRRIINTLGRIGGLQRARKAVRWVHDGSGSPLESKWALLTGIDARCGGEGWKDMLFNRRIIIPQELQGLAGQTRCIADQLLPESKTIIEVNGAAFHTDRNGFVPQSGRRSALEALGYHVFDVNYAQMRDLDAVDSLLQTIQKRCCIQLAKRTSAFLSRRYTLHDALFQRR